MPAGTDETFRGLLNRRLDIGLILDDRKPLANLTARRIGSERIDLVAARGHPAASRRVDWRGLVEFPYFRREEGCSYSDKFIDDINAMTGTTPTITRFGSIAATRAWVEAGLGPSILPRVATKTATDCRRLVRLPEPARPSIDLTLATNDRRWQSPAVTTIGSALVAVGARWEAGVPD
ncbi:MAG: LysR family transcriptional regulator substrate-binding protein [Nocardioidaceae bacterium]